MVSRENKVNFASQTTEHGIDEYVVDEVFGASPKEVAYLLSEPTNPDKQLVEFSVQEHAPGVYEIDIERGKRTHTELAMLAIAAFGRLAHESDVDISEFLEANKDIPEITLDDIVALGNDSAPEEGSMYSDEEQGERIFALVDLRQLSELEALARMNLYEKVLGMKAVACADTGELIMLGGSAKGFVGSAGWTLHGANIILTNEK